MTDTVPSQNIDRSTWDTLYNVWSSDGIELERALEEPIVA
jgi:hypothetical protein